LNSGYNDIQKQHNNVQVYNGVYLVMLIITCKLTLLLYK